MPDRVEIASGTMQTPSRTLSLAVEGLDCVGCARKLERSVAGVGGVREVNVLLAAQRVRVEFDPMAVEPARLLAAVERAGFRIPVAEDLPASPPAEDTAPRRAAVVFASIIAAVLGVAVLGEWLGLFEALTERIPLTLGLALVTVLGWGPVRNVVAATRAGRITAHTLVTIGAVVALLVGEWITAAVVMVFMRVAERVERFTTSRSRRALHELVALAPRQARVERGGEEVLIPAAARLASPLRRPGSTLLWICCPDRAQQIGTARSDPPDLYLLIGKRAEAPVSPGDGRPGLPRRPQNCTR
jgi:P-type Cu+ transporter